MSKLNILCLHGFRQDAHTFSIRLSAIRRALKGIAQLLFIDAPIVLKSKEGEDLETQRAWWNPNPDFSIDYVTKFITEHGSIDGVLGFSQGACLASLLAINQLNLKTAQPKFYILISGLPPQHKEIVIPNEEIDIPSMHIYGLTDNILTQEMFKNLKSMFKEPKVVEHDGGHYIPTSKEFKDHYKDFLKQFL